VSSAPVARPTFGETLDSSDARLLRGRRSISTAPRVLSPTPTAMPWRARAANNNATPFATRNSTHATANTTMPVMISGRRPMWSDSEPNVSSVTTRNST
jgi:hypothetical protein